MQAKNEEIMKINTSFCVGSTPAGSLSTSTLSSA